MNPGNMARGCGILHDRGKGVVPGKRVGARHHVFFVVSFSLDTRICAMNIQKLGKSGYIIPAYADGAPCFLQQSWSSCPFLP